MHTIGSLSPGGSCHLGVDAWKADSPSVMAGHFGRHYHHGRTILGLTVNIAIIIIAIATVITTIAAVIGTTETILGFDHLMAYSTSILQDYFTDNEVISIVKTVPRLNMADLRSACIFHIARLGAVSVDGGLFDFW